MTNGAGGGHGRKKVKGQAGKKPAGKAVKRRVKGKGLVPPSLRKGVPE